MGEKGLVDGTLIIAAAVDERCGLSNGSLKASLAGVTVHCSERLDKCKGREAENKRGMMKEKGPRCPCHSNLYLTVKLEKLYHSTKIELLLSLLSGQRSKGATDGRTWVKLNCTA